MFSYRTPHNTHSAQAVKEIFLIVFRRHGYKPSAKTKVKAQFGQTVKVRAATSKEQCEQKNNTAFTAYFQIAVKHGVLAKEALRAVVYVIGIELIKLFPFFAECEQRARIYVDNRISAKCFHSN